MLKFKITLNNVIRRCFHFVLAAILFYIGWNLKKIFIKENLFKLEPDYIKNTLPITYLNLNLTKEGKSYKMSLPWMDLNDTQPAYEIIDDPKIIPRSATIKAKKIFQQKPLVVWATEVHITPINDLKFLLGSFGVTVLDYNLASVKCGWPNCEAKTNLKILKSSNVIDGNPKLAEEFLKTYMQDPEMKTVDVIFCGHPASICEFYLPLNKSVLILPSTRYDIGRYTSERLNNLNNNFRVLAKNSWNIFGGNNLYDANFLKYYTGLTTEHIPSMCDYVGREYTNEIKEFLVIRKRDRGFNSVFFKNFSEACYKINCTVKFKLLGGYRYRDLVKHRALIHVPYQVSVMSIFEQYRMNIPMFVPSPELLARWQVDYYLMPERSFNGAFFNERPNASIIPPHPSQAGVPDPKNEFDYNSILYWMNFADFYQVMPYGVIYNSIPHLVFLLENIDDSVLWQISRNMRQYNVDFKKKLLTRWKHILLEFAKHSPNNPH